METETSGVWIVIASQLSWIARFVVLLGATGLVVWWARETIGFDLKRDINSIERMARDGVKDGDVKKVLPLLALLLIGFIVVGYVLGGFIH